MFNKFFTSIGKILANKIKCKQYKENNVRNSANVQEFMFESISCNFVKKQLQLLCISKATGSDGISARLLKMAAEYISVSLTHILNMSLKTGQVPQEWKHAKVIPLHKDGTKDDTNNYRPISVLPVLSKIMERAVHDQLYRHLSKHQLLNKWQSGFRPGYSTATALTYVTDLLLKEIDSKHVTGIIFLDLKKAFDTVDHELLLNKLEQYGIQQNEHKWFKSYLSSRTQSVKVNNIISDDLGIEYGVPQGSILGPMLFTLFINDLPHVTDKCKVILYADDTALLYSHTDSQQVETVLNQEIKNVTEWLNQNKLTLNTKKPQTMIVGNRSRKNNKQLLEIKVNEETVQQIPEFKYLSRCMA